MRPKMNAALESRPTVIVTRLGEAAEAGMIKLRLDPAVARTDAEIKASCYCRLSHAT